MTRGQAALDLIVLMCQGFPPKRLRDAVLRVDRLSELPDDKYEHLQAFVLSSLVPSWSTGIGTIEAIDSMVDEAVNNSTLAFEVAEPEFPDQEVFDAFVEAQARRAMLKRLRSGRKSRRIP